MRFILLIIFYIFVGEGIYAHPTISCKSVFNHTELNYSNFIFRMPFHAPESDALIAEKKETVRLFNEEVSLKDSNLKYTLFHYNEKYRTTVLYHRRDGRFHEGTQARVLLLHGYGTMGSRATAMATILRILSEKFDSNIKTSSTIRKLRERNLFLNTSAEALDLPGCGNGPPLEDFKNLDDVTDWLASYISDMKKETPTVPVYILTRSSSAAFGAAVVNKYPGLLDGVILMSPTLPGDAELLNQGIQKVKALAAQGYYKLNEPALDWMKNILYEVHWDANYFAHAPTFMMTGELDPEMSSMERHVYAGLAAENANLIYTNFTGASHNVLDTTNSLTAIGQFAYESVLTFMGKVFRKEPLK